MLSSRRTTVAQNKAMNETLLTTKLHIPPIRPEYVSRPRLLASMGDGMSRKLTMLSAPAGFGKSTLLAGWIQQEGIPAAWLSLDEGENDPSRFLTYLAAAINTVEAGVGSGIPEILQATRLSNPQSILNAFINELSSIDYHYALILDDYHLIHSEQVHDTLKYLFEHQPAHLHIYMATRADPPIPLALLRGRGELVELRSSELLFTKEESAEFIRLTTGNPLKEMDADTLTKLTEGWATGIQMAALSLKDRLDVSTFLREFSGTNRYVLDYLVEEVLETQSDQTQTFLYRTSILERMSGPLCDALLTSQSHDPDAPGFEPGDGQRFLMDLERQNLFIIPLDEQRRWYRYHHLFADLLQQRLETHHPELASQLHQQAADWYREQGLFPDAIRHSLACGDYNTAVETIAAVAEEAMMRSDFIKLKGWIDRLPDDVMADHPRLYAYHLIISIFSGIPADEVSQRFELIRKLERKGEIQGDILALQAMLAVYNQDIRGSAQYAEQALKILPEDSLFFRSTLAGFLGYAYLMYGDTDAAKRTLAESAHVSARAGNLTMQVLALCHLAEIDIIEGRLPKADAHYRLAIDTGLTTDGKPRPILGLAFIGQGMAQFEQGQFDEAYENLKQGVELIQKWTPSGAIQGYIFMAWIHQLRGEEASADALIETATELARRFEPLEEDDKYVRYQRAKMQTVRGNPTQALRLYSISPEISEKDLDRLFPPIDPDSLAGFTNLVSYMATGEAFLALGQHEVAERLISRARVVSQERGWKRVDMAFMTTLAEVHTQCGREDQALETMAEALEIAAEGGYVSDFIERGRRICGLLREALRAGIQPEFVAQLLSRIEAQDTGEAPSSPAEKASLMMIEPLSERELEVLSLVAKGHTNPEIASHLVVAVTTVKKHVSNILGKLGVSSREEAAGRGRELGLF